ncbi:phosphonate C-P lyase system protein PhnG [Ruegeria pomeroyi]|uniref:Alkylphosphonate utilization protein PhnG n=2 Tax=Ruegeria pomeroyi TaxID=89184 RepID=Q5LW74_RUEPO|nr:phosphonate C-P lyase system protein PhnG [Ruegeria pomeroyi]HCE71237.1 phosphonate C-P lyase system protein PhnG [Ruegeria sp.]AAV93786.1 alkylphosphonate utilization protein PhnG [Ruegeria pomeroyi DSS-3]NVK98641.1 phosphonate C-P lyase system protein PhnG [Ruegeria pomeroyi]NVL03876.1 phosphonate C-P lyase system protein PhnG [Ruegeria pomeroyi]QWV07375.1 phosphonate C-P lyase system protein PhnG [Ruegeria pomeroyi]
MAEQEKETAARQGWMGLLARAPEAMLMALWNRVEERPAFDWLRAPETGGVMVRGRAGGTGAPFNLGEMTVTRCALALADGTVGHAYVQGRSRAKAEAAALIDALMQTAAADTIRALVLDPLAAQMAERSEGRAARAAATKVEFFTLVRGED